MLKKQKCTIIKLCETKYREAGITIDKLLFESDYLEFTKNYHSQIIMNCKNGISLIINSNPDNSYCSGYIYDPFLGQCIDLSLNEICSLLF